jgi:PASTA domain
MNATTAMPARTAEHGTEGQRGKPRGLVVNEYVGQTAADAATSIRRAGLRPGLERSLGCDPELVGQVIAQEPPAGSELARNAMVTLYVAAPGAAPDDESLDPQPAREPAVSPPATAQASLPDVRGQHATARRRRRRKPGLAGRPSPAIDTPPALVRPDADPAPVAPALTDTQPTDEWISHEEIPSPAAEDRDLRDQVLDDEATEELSYDEFVACANEVFAGRASVSWRRAYPARYRLARSRIQHNRRWSQ